MGFRGNKMDKDKMAQFVDKSYWRFAKTMPKNPHEYTVREWCFDRGDSDREFEEVVWFIREAGRNERFWRTTYQYYYLGDFKYWTMGAPVEDTTIINRARTGE